MELYIKTHAQDEDEINDAMELYDLLPNMYNKYIDVGDNLVDAKLLCKLLGNKYHTVLHVDNNDLLFTK